MLFGVALRFGPVAVSLAVAGAALLWRRFDRDRGGASAGDEFVSGTPPKAPPAVHSLNALWRTNPLQGTAPQEVLPEKAVPEGNLQEAKQSLQNLINDHMEQLEIFDKRAQEILDRGLHPVYELEGTEDFVEEGKALIDLGICFTLREFDFPQNLFPQEIRDDRPGASFYNNDKVHAARKMITPLIEHSLPHCRSEADIVEAMNGMFYAAASQGMEGALEEIAAHHWSDSPEFARKFLEVQLSVSHFRDSPHIRNATVRAILNLIPPDAEPPPPDFNDWEDMDFDSQLLYSAVWQAVGRIGDPDSYREGEDPTALLRALVAARPAFTDFFCHYTCCEHLGRPRNRWCW